MPSKVKANNAALYAEADAAGLAAAAAVKPAPMYVVERENPWDDRSPIAKAYAPVMDGVCGFAWINVPGNSSFGRYVAGRGASRGFYGGMNVRVSGFGQSYERKMAYAQAFAGALREAGVKGAYADGRLD